jgi:PBP1b-binding outer membrane lipoprotein LpoB
MKRISVIIAIAGMLAVLAGCQKQEAAKPAEQPAMAPATAPTTTPTTTAPAAAPAK